MRIRRYLVLSLTVRHLRIWYDCEKFHSIDISDYNNKKYRHLCTESLSAITGVNVDIEYRFISWSASRRASSSISFSSCSPLFVSEKFPVMSFVGHFPYRTEKLNAKVLSDIQFHDATGKRDLRTPLCPNLDIPWYNHNIYNLYLYHLTWWKYYVQYHVYF